jgi:hypothetical protein
LDQFAVLTRVDLRDLVGKALGVLFGQELNVHEFFLEFADLFLVQLDLVADLADQVRVKSLENVRDVLHFLETALLTVQLLDLILKADDLLLHLFLLT